MKKLNLVQWGLVGCLILSPVLGSAQQMPSFEGNYYKDYVGQRAMVVSPSSLVKNLTHTISNDGGGGAGEWGGSIPSSGMLNVPLAKCAPYDACAPITNAGDLNGKVALVERGDCEFSQKAKAVQDAGAVAIIIVNNIPGDPVGMGAGSAAGGVTIPVIMISQADGAVLSQALDNSTAIEVSFTHWGNGHTNDIGIVDAGVTGWVNSVTPLHMMNANSLNKAPFKGINAAVVANFGTADQTGVKLVSTVTWNPDGGSPTVVYKDSVVGLSLAAGDSIISPYGNEYTLPAPTTTGRYDVEHVVSMDNADEFIDDNTMVSSFYVSDHILSKGRFDFNEDEGISLLGYSYANGIDFIWGPLYYIPEKDHQIRSAQFNLLSSANPDFSLQPPVNIIVWKWDDASGNGVIEQGELDMVGIGNYEFVSGDSTGDAHWVNLVDAMDNTKMVLTEDDAHYWVVLTVPTGTFLGVDSRYNAYPRAWARAQSSGYKEAYAPIFPGSASVFDQSSTNEAFMYPYEGTQDIDSVRFVQQKSGLMPSIPLNIAPWPISVKDMDSGLEPIGAKVYPNPASNVLNLELNLTKEAKKVHFTVFDGTGRPVGFEHAGPSAKQGNFQIKTDHLAAGSYYLLINVDGVATARPFTIVR